MNDEWEKDVIEKLATDALKERRRSRRWGIFFKLLSFIYVAVIIAMLVPEKWDQSIDMTKEHTALVDLEGVIAAGEKASADNVVTGLRNAFKDENTKAVILRINSPGGSPVQSSYINREMHRLREKYPEIPLYAVVSDVCASGGYYIAVAAEKIYVNESSVVGSIGVLMNSFGFVGAMEKLGIERRLLTAGDHKGVMDPFTPMSEFDKKHLDTVLNELHQEFIAVVRKGRGDRLKENDETFSGLFWSGKQSVEQGLTDDFGSSSYVAREIIGVEKLVDFTKKPDPFERFAAQIGAGATKAMALIMGIGTTPQF